MKAGFLKALVYTLKPRYRKVIVINITLAPEAANAQDCCIIGV